MTTATRITPIAGAPGRYVVTFVAAPKPDLVPAATTRAESTPAEDTRPEKHDAPDETVLIELLDVDPAPPPPAGEEPAIAAEEPAPTWTWRHIDRRPRAALAVVGGAIALAVGAQATLGVNGVPALVGLVAGVLLVVAVALFRPAWACALVFATTAIGNQVIPGAPLGLQVVHGICVVCLTAVALAMVAGAPADRILRPELRLPLVFGAALVLAAVVSTTVSVSPDKSVKVTATLATGLLLAVAMILVARTGKTLRLLIAAAVIGSSFVTLPALSGAGQLTAVYGGSIVKHRPSGAFTDPNELGCYAAMATLLALGWLLAAQRRAERVLATISALGAIAALAVSLSRGAWFGTALGVGVLVALHPRARKPAGWLAVGGCLAALAGVLIMPSSGPVHVVLSRLNSVSDPAGNPYDVRPITWGEALREFSAAPVLGNGPGSFSVMSAQSPSELEFYPRQHAHNVLLTMAAETGSTGALALIGMVTTLIIAIRGRARRLRETARNADLGLLAGCAGALAALLGHLTVDYPLRNPTLMIFVWAVFGLVLAATAIPVPGRPSRTAEASHR